MGRKSNFFRHSIEAHNDPKIMTLLKKGKLKSVGFYFTLLEVYARAFFDSDNDKSSVDIHIRRIANATGLRTDSTLTQLGLLSDCKLIEPVRYKSGVSMIQVDIPNFSKYHGSYHKSDTPEIPNNNNNNSKNNNNNNKTENDFCVSNFSNSYNSQKATVTPDEIIQLFNDKLVDGTNIKHCLGLSGQHVKDMVEIIQGRLKNKNDWVKLIDTIHKSDKLMLRDPDWKYPIRITWLCNESKVMQILNGDYDNTTQSKCSDPEDLKGQAYRKEILRKIEAGEIT